MKNKHRKLTGRDAVIEHVRQTGKRVHEVRGGVQVHENKRRKAESKDLRQQLRGG
jgi:hypothetical protein